MLHLIITRRKESYNWIKCKTNAEIHYLNVPDALDITDEEKNYGKKIFESINNNTQFNYLSNKIKKIIGQNILLTPNYDRHPSHILAFSLAQSLNNKKIYYSVQGVLQKDRLEIPGLYFNRIDILGIKYITYCYILNKAEFNAKKKDFQIYYNSQYMNFAETNLNLKNWEYYISEVPLCLAREDRTYKDKKEGIIL